MIAVEQIEGLLKSFCSLFYLGSPNHKLMVEKCIEIAARNSMGVYGYNISQGIWRPGGAKPKKCDTDPIEMLDRILELNHEAYRTERKLFLLEHFDVVLENRDPLVLTKLRLINDCSAYRYAVVLMGRPYFQLPEIISDIPRVCDSILDDQDIRNLLSKSQKGISAKRTEELSDALAGLTLLECENLLSFSLAKFRRLDRQFIRKEKAALLSQKAQQLIELCEPESDLTQVGGLDALKDWLLKRTRFMKCKSECNGKFLPPPKGIILTGPPGCGKSFLVSALAGSWEINLIRLDSTRLLSSPLGQTEQNLRTALQTVRSLAPCVLWIDEFEKFFPQVSNSDADGGVSSRVLGLLLDFLQENREGVFVCGTTNNLLKLPQEAMRAGRFDAIFFIDLPNRRERQSILNVILQKYGLKRKFDGSEAILDATEGFSGAELEQAVLETLYEYADSEAEITEFMLLKLIKRMVPLADTMEEEISAMRNWCYSRVRYASYPEDAMQVERRKICPTSRE